MAPDISVVCWAKELSDVLVTFLQRSGYNDNIRLPPEELKALYDYVHPFLPDSEKIVRQFCHYVHCTFPFLSLDLRRLTALYNSLQMSVDDIPEEEHGSLHNLCAQLSDGAVITHPVWNAFFTALPYLLSFYGSYAQTTLFRTPLELIQAICLDGTFFRAVLCFPKREFPQNQYLTVIVSLVAELEQFVATRVRTIAYPLREAACSGRSVLEILRELVEVSIGCRDRVQAIIALQADGKLTGRIAEFFTGYVRYHLSCNHYRILSLCEESGNKQLLGFYQMSAATIGDLQRQTDQMERSLQ
ncbi:hypothetical protein BDW69DRAFT_200864 [Aspergillus filifer]